MQKRIFLLLSICGFSLFTIHAQQGWEMEKNKKDVMVFTRSVEGFDVKAFKAFGDVNAPIHQVYNVIKDVENYGSWYPDCKQGELLETVNDSTDYRRLIYKLPWPFDPRDVVVKLESERMPNGILMTTYNATEYKDPVKGVVRIEKIQGYWQLIENNGITSITYEGVADSGGLPAWIVNMFIVGGPIEAINNLREMVKKPEYQFVPEWLN